MEPPVCGDEKAEWSPLFPPPQQPVARGGASASDNVPPIVPADSSSLLVRNSMRMKLVTGWTSAVQYTLAPEEVFSEMSWQLQSKLRAALGICTPAWVFLKSGGRHEGPRSRTSVRQGVMSRRLYGATWGWSPAARVAATAATVVAFVVWDVWEQGNELARLATLGTPRGEYCRWVLAEGSRLQEAGLMFASHPPLIIRTDDRRRTPEWLHPQLLANMQHSGPPFPTFPPPPPPQCSR
eukprot:TRINITY_DN224_c0_g3_i1.p1 TRINITY_DN224_c0_g3~~TRINITY_DN224_c0_g3_i1.p1  ORF type:complete len:238 (+),score=10.73 TRINITY_DN224_c0_g3_i1:392-1105(+)